MTVNESRSDRREASEIFELSDQFIVDSAALDPMLASFWGIPGDRIAVEVMRERVQAEVDLINRANITDGSAS